MRGQRRLDITAEDRHLIRELGRENNLLSEKILAIDRQLLFLMAERDRLVEKRRTIDPKAISEKFGISKTAVVYIMRPRSAKSVC